MPSSAAQSWDLDHIARIFIGELSLSLLLLLLSHFSHVWLCATPPGSRPWDSLGKHFVVGCHVILKCMKVKSESGASVWSPVNWLQPHLLLSGFWVRVNPYKVKELSAYQVLKVKMLVAQSCPTLCNAMDCSPPGSSDHGILQARILEWVVSILSFGGYSRPRDQTRVSHIAGRLSTIWATREDPLRLGII